MLLFDTPETKHPEKHVQPFGLEASAMTKKLLEGKTGELEKDVSERDKYGRLLAYVYVDRESVQEALLEKGLARVAVYPPDVKNVDKCREIHVKAQKACVGIWSIENYARKMEVVKKKGPGTGKSTSSTPKLKPQPQKQPQIEQTVEQIMNDVFNANCSEARAAGAVPLYRGEPGYRSKLDRDNDGIACE
ncbi:thermonuclease family protein [Brevibacillus thermoruber]|uniref:thermonuclease family protein n=1 Tax=Brevibacillus thermoruber TaxID=33942 RepID=UPI0006910D59|nr:thermonuclease family protein [Brevibacillus thermoruber]